MDGSRRTAVPAFASSAAIPLRRAHLVKTSLCGLHNPVVHVSTRQKCTLRPTMSIQEEVSSSLKTSMKAKDADATRALRMIRAGLLTKMKEDGSDTISDEDAVAVLRKLAKMRAEAIEMFSQGGRDDLVENEKKDLAVVERWLPKLANEEVTRAWAEEAIAASGASGPSQAGKAIGALMKAHKGEVDGALAKKIVTELLTA